MGGEETKNWIKYGGKAILEGHDYQRRWFVGGDPISAPCQRTSMGVKLRRQAFRDVKIDFQISSLHSRTGVSDPRYRIEIIEHPK